METVNCLPFFIIWKAKEYISSLWTKWSRRIGTLKETATAASIVLFLLWVKLLFQLFLQQRTKGVVGCVLKAHFFILELKNKQTFLLNCFLFRVIGYTFAIWVTRVRVTEKLPFLQESDCIFQLSQIVQWWEPHALSHLETKA